MYRESKFTPSSTEAANLKLIEDLLDDDTRNEKGQEVRFQRYHPRISHLDSFIIDELVNTRPLMAGLVDSHWTMGHAYIIYGVDYAKVETKTFLGSSSKRVIKSLLLFDPSIGTATSIDMNLFRKYLGFVMAVYIDPDPIRVNDKIFIQTYPGNWSGDSEATHHGGGGGRGGGRGGGHGGGGK